MHKKTSLEPSESDIGVSFDSFLDASGVMGMDDDECHPARLVGVSSKLAVMEEEQAQSNEGDE